MEDNIKKALLDGSATIQTKIEIITNDEENIILDEQNSVVSWDYEDFRYVKDEGWIGQFVARQVNGVVKNISDDFSMTDKEFVLHMGVKIGDNTTWYNLGNFLVNKVTDDEVNDKTSFEALDYTKKFNQTYVDSITYPCTALELAQNVCGQCGCELGNTNFKHNDWEITGNVFTNGESCREVLKAIGKLAYSWVRIDWDNKVYIDFIKKTEVNEYNKINNSNYYSLTTQKEKIGAINRVVIGYKDIEGERTKVEDTESINANGVNEITIYDNPLVYNQELREKAIVGAEDLFGLEYLPLETLTVGHPWLKGNELVEVTNMEGKVHKTIPFDRTIQYFGHIKTKINVATNTKTNTEYAYESGIGGRLRKTEIMVDKINGQITEVIKEQDENTKKLNETISTVEETKQTISSVETTVENITTTTQTRAGGNSLYITDSLESNALEYHVDGKSEQDGEPTPDVPVEIKSIPSIRNLFDGLIEVGRYDNDTGQIVDNVTGVTRNVNPIYLKSNSEYIFSNNGVGIAMNVLEYKNDGTFLKRTVVTANTSFVTTNETEYINFYRSSTDVNKIQLEKDSLIHFYVPYGAWVKVKITGKNIVPFIENVDYKMDSGSSFYGCIYYIPVNPNTSYILSKKDNSSITCQIREYGINKEIIQSTAKMTGSTFVTTSETKYIRFRTNALITEIEKPIIQIEEATKENTIPTEYEDYKEKEVLIDLNIYDEDGNITGHHELSSIGDTKDTINIVNGQVAFNQNIEKIDSYNGETITTNYISTTGELTTGATVYYLLAEPKQITLPNVQIPLFEGVNHISLVDDLETTTSIKYYRNTPIAKDYVVQQQLNETNTNLSTTTDKTNQNASDINATNTNLNNNYYNKDQIDVMNTSTEQVITQIRNQVETTTTATNLQISILQEQLTNGITKVDTKTGYTFDKDGLKIEKSGSEMSSLLDNDGLVVKRNTTEVLTVSSSGVETENLKVRTYFTIGTNTRVENYKGGTGFFYIGGDS